MKTRMVGIIVIVAALGVAPALAQQQPPQGPPQGQPPQGPGAPPDPGPLNANQIQRWFEAYTVLQAQDQLQLSEAQYGRFVTRLKLLQESRRRHQLTRNQILGDLRRLTAPQAAADEAQMAERIKALREHEERAAAELRKAYDGVDETLDLRQQARFRVFEDRMEQQKLELLMRARQNARNAQRGRGRGSS